MGKLLLELEPVRKLKWFSPSRCWEGKSFPGVFMVMRKMPFMLGTGARENCCVTSVSLSCVGRAGAAASAMSEKVRTRLEELDDFEEVSSPLLGLSEQSVSSPSHCTRPPGSLT